MDPGPCSSNLPSYYFDTTSGQCRVFTYGGCQGNANRFDNMMACEDKCLDEPMPFLEIEIEGKDGAKKGEGKEGMTEDEENYNDDPFYGE